MFSCFSQIVGCLVTVGGFLGFFDRENDDFEDYFGSVRTRKAIRAEFLCLDAVSTGPCSPSGLFGTVREVPGTV